MLGYGNGIFWSSKPECRTRQPLQEGVAALTCARDALQQSEQKPECQSAEERSSGIDEEIFQFCIVGGGQCLKQFVKAASLYAQTWINWLSGPMALTQTPTSGESLARVGIT